MVHNILRLGEITEGIKKKKFNDFSSGCFKIIIQKEVIEQESDILKECLGR